MQNGDIALLYYHQNSPGVLCSVWGTIIEEGCRKVEACLEKDNKDGERNGDQVL